MLNLPTELENSLASGKANIHYLILLSGNMDNRFFTTYSEIVSDGEAIYHPQKFISLENIAYLANNTVTAIDIEFMYQDDTETKKNVIFGKWDGARVLIYLFDSKKLDGENRTLETYLAFRGNISDIKKIEDQTATIEISSLIDKLDIEKSRKYAPDKCRAIFGDSVCQFDISGNSVSDTLASGSYTQSTITDSQFSSFGDGFFVSGYIEFSTGKNEKLNAQISQHIGDTIYLASAFPYDLQDGDSFRVVPVCTKTFADCSSKFDNTNNFYGDKTLIERNWSF